LSAVDLANENARSKLPLSPLSVLSPYSRSKHEFIQQKQSRGVVAGSRTMRAIAFLAVHKAYVRTGYRRACSGISISPYSGAGLTHRPKA